jgi:hypothetical protein
MVKRPSLIWLRLGGIFDRSGVSTNVLSALPPRTNQARPEPPRRGF